MPADPPDEIRFSFDWLGGAAAKQVPLTVCPDGHLVVRGNTHWSPVGISQDLRAVVCRVVEHEGGDR